MKKQQPIEVHMLAKGLAFPIAIFIYQGEEKVTLQYLLNNMKAYIIYKLRHMRMV